MPKAKKTSVLHACQSREETMDAIKVLGDMTCLDFSHHGALEMGLS